MSHAKDLKRYKGTQAYDQAEAKYRPDKNRFQKDLSLFSSMTCYPILKLIGKKTVIIGLEDVLAQLSIEEIKDHNLALPVMQDSLLLGMVFSCYFILCSSTSSCGHIQLSFWNFFLSDLSLQFFAEAWNCTALQCWTLSSRAAATSLTVYTAHMSCSKTSTSPSNITTSYQPTAEVARILSLQTATQVPIAQIQVMGYLFHLLREAWILNWCTLRNTLKDCKKQGMCQRQQVTHQRSVLPTMDSLDGRVVLRANKKLKFYSHNV
eukprot:TRINITY_DN853_c0_g1_i1.p1 TRINITY_DN853_c0_g1~~TRINITY_DN853_c0_g1_i1.p1  ORF type:complete len:264 (-),score=-22.16 TRINITY_DN853_c0_g1_i1:90-881(-)